MSAMSDEQNHPANRRIDRIRAGAFVEGLDDLSLEDLRERRDECLAEREYLSLLRRLVQGRAEILAAELGSRGDDEATPLVERLNTILTSDEPQSSSRGEAVRVGVPDEEMLLARRRVERLVADAAISDPTALEDAALAQAVEQLTIEEANVSEARSAVISVLDTLQAELKRRYKDDPTLALR
jgi:hypothetical protein